MNDALTKAATEASEVLGMSVEHPRFGVVEVYDALDSPAGSMPVESFTGNDAEALAYLEGLETGARIQRERYARLRRAADDVYLWCCTYAQDFRLTDTCQNLKAGLAETEALSNLEG